MNSQTLDSKGIKTIQPKSSERATRVVLTPQSKLVGANNLGQKPATFHNRPGMPQIQVGQNKNRASAKLSGGAKNFVASLIQKKEGSGVQPMN